MEWTAYRPNPRVREDTPPANATPKMLGFAETYLADGDPAIMRVRYGRVAALLFLVASVYGLVVAPAVGGPSFTVQLAVVAVSFVTVVVIYLLPWARLPNWSTVAPAVVGVVLLSVGGAVAGELLYYTCMYAALFAYTGLTQRPGISGRCGVLALAGLAAAAVWGKQDSDLVQITVTILVAVCVGELISLSAAWQRHSRIELVVLQIALNRLVAAETEAEAATIVAEVAKDLLQADAVVTVLSVRPGSPLFVGRGGSRDADFTHARTDISVDDSGTARCIRSGQPVFIADATKDPGLRQDLVRKNEVRSTLFIPVPGEGGWLGSLTVWWKTPRREIGRFSEQTLDLLTTQAGQVIQRLREVGRLDEAATTDPLTGIGNRRSFDEELSRLPVGGSVIVLDLDYFKDVNDTHGHPTGDDVLRRFASMISMCVRDGDSVARLGGDEFALFLPTEDSDAAAVAVLDRIATRWPRPLDVTFSAGVAQRQPSESVTETLVRADTALYENKHGSPDRRRARQAIATA